MKISGVPHGPPPGSWHFVPGKQYQFRVSSVANGRAVLILNSGVRATATLDSPVVTGRTYVARAITRTHLHLLSQSAAEIPSRSSVPAEFGLPDRPASYAVIRAFMSAGLPLRRTSLQRALRRTQSDDSRLSRAERARLAALLEQRGLTDEQSWLRMTLLLGGGDHGRRERRDEEPRREPTRGSVVQRLQRSIRFSPNGDDVLQLFNHVVSGDDHWVIIPFSVGRIDGTIRLLVPATRTPNVHALDYTTAVVEVVNDGRRTLFSLENGDHGLELRAVSGDRLSAESMLDLQLRLERIGVSVIDEHTYAIREGGEFDGFSTWIEADILPRTDRRV